MGRQNVNIMEESILKKIAMATARKLVKMQRENVQSKVIELQIGDSVVNVEISPLRTAAEKTVFINRVLDACFDANGWCNVEYVTPMTRATFIQMCTNLPTLTLEERGPDEEELMDVDAMNDLYLALGDDELQSYWDLEMLIDEAVRFRKGLECARIAQKSRIPDDLAAILDGLKSIVSLVNEKIEEIDMNALMQYAAQLAAATEGVDSGNIIDALVAMHERNEV